MKHPMERGLFRRVQTATARGALHACACAALLALAACGATIHGAFAADRYTSGYGYDISYQQGSKQVLPAAWVIDNYRRDHGELVPKDEDRYNTKYEFDDNEDDTIDHEIELPTYALRYEHKVHSGVIWLRNIPLAKKLRTKDLRVLMQSYIDEISGTSYEAIRFTARRIVVERQAPTVAMVIEEGPATVAGLPAYVATLEIAKADEVKVAPVARTRRIQLVLMRAPKDEEIKFLENDITNKEMTSSYPVVVLAGYSNMPTDFPAGLEEFHDLLQRVSVAGKHGLTLETAPTVQPPQASHGPAPDPKAPASVATPPAATP